MDPRAVRDVVVEAHGKRIGFLEYHADPLAQVYDVGIGSVDIGAFVKHGTLDPNAAYQVVQPVERAEERGFTASGRTDQRRDAPFLDVDGDVLQRLGRAIPEIEVADAEFRGRLLHGVSFTPPPGDASCR
jgi:hypothetical protein